MGRIVSEHHNRNRGHGINSGYQIKSVMVEKVILTRKQLEDFYYNKKSITACYYCKGRDYAFGEIDAAIQTKRPLTIAKAN